MRRALVGYTGFVGSNLAASTDFDGLYNSANIKEAYGTAPDFLVYSGLRAEKFLANRSPKLDERAVGQAKENIRRIGAGHTVLVSTVDVYPLPRGVDETTPIDPTGLAPYGRNRLELERWVRESCPRHLIVRLPALFGRNLKKNFIYDLAHPVPGMLSPQLYERLAAEEPVVAQSYEKNDYGFWQLCPGTGEDPRLAEALSRAGFDSRSFTDSRSRFQFFDLSLLWGLMERALELGIDLLNVTSEPVSAAEVHVRVFGGEFVNERDGAPQDYDVRTVHDAELGGAGGYLYDRAAVLDGLAAFLGGGVG